MKNVSLEMNNEALNVVADLFDIEVEGVEKEALVEKVNAAIEDLKSSKISRAKAKWFEAPNAFPYAEGDTIKIVAGDGLIDRFAEVIRASSKQNALKCFLLNPTTGERQGTLITMDFFKIEKSEFVPVAPKATKKEAEATETPASIDTQEPADEPQESVEQTESIETSIESQEDVEQSESKEEVAV